MSDGDSPEPWQREEEGDRSDILAHFQEITGLEDEERSLSVLRSYQWNLEAAVQDVLNEHDGLSSVFNEPHPSPPPPPPPHPHPLSRSAAAGSTSITGQLSAASTHSTGMVPRHSTWWAWITNILFLPIRFVMTSASDALQFVVNLLFGFQPPPARNAQADVALFVSEFQAQYGHVHPPFVISSYSQALNVAKQDLKFLLVYLHSPEHNDTPSFCRDVLSSRELMDFVRERNVLVWGVSVGTEEGARVSYVMRETTYPFLALVVQLGGRMVVVGRVEGPLPLEELLPRLRAFMNEHEGALLEERRERERRSQDQLLRQEQDLAYQDSLRADREKQRVREEKRRREEEEAQREIERALEVSRKEQELAMRRSSCVERLPPEPSSSQPHTLSVVLRMPGGQRVERRFLTSDLLQSVYDLAHTSDEVPNHFSLVMSYPRKELVCEEGGGPTLGTLGLGPKCVLIVEGVEGEEEEEGA